MKQSVEVSAPQGSRDSVTGQYTHKLSAICRCGHSMGEHAGCGPVKTRDCMAHDVLPNTPYCDCKGFRAARTRKVSRTELLRQIEHVEARMQRALTDEDYMHDVRELQRLASLLNEMYAREVIWER